MNPDVCSTRAVRSLAFAAAGLLGVGAGGAMAQDLANFEVFQTITGAVYLGSPPGEPERILIGRLHGLVYVVENGVLREELFLDISQRIRLGHGLIGMAFPPDYPKSRRFYVNYTPVDSTQVRVARYTTSADPNIANDTEEILLHTGLGSGDHCSGWMDFSPIDGYLYIARGDSGGNPQDPMQPQGKIHRIDVSPEVGYAIPPDNPYVGGPGLDEIVALGLRNPWRNGFDSLTGDLYISDVGNLTEEEISFVPAGTIVGRNFGWPCVEGNVCQNDQPPCDCQGALTPPVFSYPRTFGYAVIGGTVYRGSAIPRWRGRYFFADFGSDRIWSFRVVNGVMTDLRDHTDELNEGLPDGQGLNNPASFGTDGYGELYLIERGGRILKLASQFAPADWNTDSLVNSADFFDFLVDFFNLDADLTGDHVTTSADFFEYLTLFFGE